MLTRRLFLAAAPALVAAPAIVRVGSIMPVRWIETRRWDLLQLGWLPIGRDTNGTTLARIVVNEGYDRFAMMEGHLVARFVSGRNVNVLTVGDVESGCLRFVADPPYQPQSMRHHFGDTNKMVGEPVSRS